MFTPSRDHQATMEPKELLLACKAVFEELIQKYGNKGASLGILKDGKADYLTVGAGTTLGEETVHLISSMTKPVLAIAIGILVASGKLELETLVGMTRSTADMSCRRPNDNIAGSYCAGIQGEECRDLLGSDQDSIAVHERFLNQGPSCRRSSRPALQVQRYHHLHWSGGRNPVHSY